MRLGIFGGTFDPVHYGHLLLAECCREQLRLEKVWFLPAAVPPHKQARELAPAEQRIEMLELALGGHEAFEVCRYEMEGGGVNYTVDTLAHFKEADAGRELFFLMGADSLRDLPTWKEPERLCRLAVPVVVRRRGEADLADTKELGPLGARLERVEMPAIELSSSELRRRVAEGRSIRYRTPRAVEKYIESHGLYRAPEEPEPAAGCPGG
jgi:nicotinate-nucleotide adenylyltransferase